MPAKKRAAIDHTDGSSISKPKKAKPSKKYKMPPPIAEGEVLTALDQSKWKIETSVGKGGFGEIYSAAALTDKFKGEYVVKVEPKENGPLFTELAFYQRVAKVDKISSWTKKNRLTYLSIPQYVASGNHEYLTNKYRFMIMERYGVDVEKQFCNCERQFAVKTVCTLGLRLLEALEFLHSEEYVHGDIKGSNVLTGIHNPEQVFLVDYGLAEKFTLDGKHRLHEEDKRRAHNGTIEFTSRDAHSGVRPSRRGDLEILGYCLLQWASGTLPWMGLTDCAHVAKEKITAFKDVDCFVTKCFAPKAPPQYLKTFLEAVKVLEYDSIPNYVEMGAIFRNELKRVGTKDDNKDLDWTTEVADKAPETSKPAKRPRKNPKPVPENPKPVPELDDSGVLEEPPKVEKIAKSKSNPKPRQRKVAVSKNERIKSSKQSSEISKDVLPSPPPATERRGGLRNRKPISYAEDTPPRN